MQTTYRFRLYPTKEQEKSLLWTLDKCRYVYNFLLAELENQKVIDKAQLQEMITDLKRIEPELQNVHSSNLKSLSQTKKKGRKVGSLRFKGKNWFKTFSYNQSGFAIMQNHTRYDKLCLSKIGEIPFIMHRNVEGKIKQVAIKHHIGIEDLHVKNMVKNRHLAKSISDASWSGFVQILCYKAERAGCTVVKVDPRGTTQKCSSCGKEVHKELWNRIHKCECGLMIDRDYNSAMNILKKALLSERQEYTPVEIELLFSNEQAWSGKQEAPCDSWE